VESTPTNPDSPQTGTPDVRPVPNLSRKKKLLFFFVIFIITGAVGLALFEVGLRIVAPQPLLPRYVIDSGFGIRKHAPNIDVHHTTADYRINVRTNSMGIRDDREFQLAKPDNTFRVVGLGDSFTFGYGVEKEETYLALAEKTLREMGMNVEIINLAVSGFGTAEQIIMLEKVGLGFDPDMVTVGFYVNDIADNVRSMLYVLDQNRKPRRHQESYLPAVKVREFLYSFAIYRYLAEHSHALYFVRRAVADFLQKRLKERNEKKLGDAETPTSQSHAQTQPSRGPAQLAAALLDQLKRVVTQRGKTICIIDIPEKTNRSHLPREFFQGVTEEEVIDLRPSFEKAMKTRLIYWQKSDGHWTPEGHKIAAKLLVEKIAERYRQVMSSE
jgi:hypothetical protein